ncbi:unnamed protein product [Schistocephalus solidus]|uniref:Protein phosphatase 1 regulatory subunit 37 n=1 Tax=Schistocephalus solidus TaxID=70667 RepID=A0A183SDW6_SCHSO|nr:unnamed protein product [Schistocephalus solidus]
MSTDIANAAEKAPVSPPIQDTPDVQWSVSFIHNENPQTNALTSSKSKRRVRFPEDDSLIVGYLDPFVPTSDNCTSDELISAYIASCKYYKVAPIEFLLEQLKVSPVIKLHVLFKFYCRAGHMQVFWFRSTFSRINLFGIDLSICNERYSRLSLKGVRFSRLQVETMEEVFRRVHFREIDLEDAYLDDSSATALFDIMLYYESCIDLSISFSIDRTVPSTAWQRCVAYLRKSSALRYFKLSHTPLAVHHFMGLNLSGLSLEKICFRDCNLSGAVLFELVRWLRYLMTLTESSSVFMGTGSGDLSAAGNNEGSQKSGRNGSRRYPRLSFRGPQVSGLWALSLHLPENRITSVDAETLISLIRHQLVILPGPPTPCKARNGVTDDSPEELQVENRPIGGSGYLLELNLARNNFRDEGVNILCTGLLQAYRMQQRRLEVATAAIAEATEGKKLSKSPKSTAVEDAEPVGENLSTGGAAAAKQSGRLTLPPSCALPGVRGLERLCLSDNGLTSISARDLAHVVAQSTERMAPLIGGLTHLDLSNNPGFGDEGVEVLCEGLIKNCTLRELILRNVRMGFGGIFALSGYLGESRSLVLLDIRQNSIDLAGVMALTKTMTINESLTSLLSDARNPLTPIASKDADLMQTFLVELDNCLRRNRHSALKQKSKLPSEEAVQLTSTNSDPTVHSNETSALRGTTDSTNHVPAAEDQNAPENEENGVMEETSITTESLPIPHYQGQSPTVLSLSAQSERQLPDQLIEGKEECEIGSEQTNRPLLCDNSPDLATFDDAHLQTEEELITSPPSPRWPPITVDEYEDYVSSDPLRLLEEGTSPVLNDLQSLGELENVSPPLSLPILLENESTVDVTLPFALPTGTRAKVRRISEISSTESSEGDVPQSTGEELLLPALTEEKQGAIGVDQKISQAFDQEIPPRQFGFGPNVTSPPDLASVSGSPLVDEIKYSQSSPEVPPERSKSPAALQETATANAPHSPQFNGRKIPFPTLLTAKLITLEDPSLYTTTAEVLAGEASDFNNSPPASCEQSADSHDHLRSETNLDLLTGKDKVCDVSDSATNPQADASSSELVPIGVDTEFSSVFRVGHVRSDSRLCGTYHGIENASAAAASVPISKAETCPLSAVDPSTVDSMTNRYAENAETPQRNDNFEPLLLLSPTLDSSGPKPGPNKTLADYCDHRTGAVAVDGKHHCSCPDNPAHPLSPGIKIPIQDVDLALGQRTPPSKYQASMLLVKSNEESLSGKLGQLSTVIDSPVPSQVTSESDKSTHEVEHTTLFDATDLAGIEPDDNEKGELKANQQTNCPVIATVVELDRLECAVNLAEDQADDKFILNLRSNEDQGSVTLSAEKYVPLEPVTKSEPSIQQASKLPLTLSLSLAEYQQAEDERRIVEKVKEAGSSHWSDLNAQSHRIDEPSHVQAFTSETISDLPVEVLSNRTDTDSKQVEGASLHPLYDAENLPTDSLPDQPTQTLTDTSISFPRLDNTIECRGYSEEQSPSMSLATEMRTEPIDSANQNDSKDFIDGLNEDFFNPAPGSQSEKTGGEFSTSSSITHELSLLRKSQEGLGSMKTDYMLGSEHNQQPLCTSGISNLTTIFSEMDPPDKSEKPAPDAQLPFSDTAFAHTETSAEACMLSRRDSPHQLVDSVDVLRSADNGVPDLRTSIPPLRLKHDRTSDLKGLSSSSLSHGVCSVDGDSSTPPNGGINPTPFVSPPLPDSWDNKNWGDFESDGPQLSMEFEKDAAQMSEQPSNTCGLPLSTVSGQHDSPVSSLLDEGPDTTTGKAHVD